MFGSSFKIATVWGIPIRVHMSLLILLLLIAMSFHAYGWPIDFLLGLLLGVCLFTSIALHELGHSYVAIRKGCRVREITLIFIGGAAQMEEIPSRPRDEFLMAVAGPAVSVAIGVLCLVAGARLPLPESLWPLPLVRGSLRGNFVEFVGAMNLGLAAFNLMPAFPMDGGRVVRAVLAHRMGRLRATFLAARLGKILAVVFGLHSLMQRPIQFFGIAIAFFIFSAAETEFRMVELKEAARRYGFGAWSGPEDHGTPDDEVDIGPPPYRKGRGSRTEIRPEGGRSSFGRWFRS